MAQASLEVTAKKKQQELVNDQIHWYQVPGDSQASALAVRDLFTDTIMHQKVAAAGGQEAYYLETLNRMTQLQLEQAFKRIEPLLEKITDPLKRAEETEKLALMRGEATAEPEWERREQWLQAARLLEHQLTAAQQPALKFLGLAGGGAKGAVYVGAVHVLEEQHILENLEGVAGTSAGSLVAAFIATGIKAERFERIAAAQRFDELLGEGKGPGGFVQKDGSPLQQVIARTVQENINNYAQERVDQDIIRIVKAIETRISRAESPEIQQGLENLLESCRYQADDLDALVFFEKLLEKNAQIRAIHAELAAAAEGLKPAERFLTAEERTLLSETATPNVTFGGLKALHAAFPERFKDLSVNAVSVETGKTVIFTTRTDDPTILNVGIAEACRASMSIPVLMQQASIKMGAEGREHKFVDGALQDNLLTQAFSSGGVPAPQSEVLLLGLSSKGQMADPISKNIFTGKQNLQGVQAKGLADWLVPLKTPYKFTRFAKEREIAQDYPMSYGVLSSPGIGLKHFKRATHLAVFMGLSGYFAAENHLQLYNHIKDPEQVGALGLFLLDHFRTSGGIKKGAYDPQYFPLLEVIEKLRGPEVSRDTVHQVIQEYAKICIDLGLKPFEKLSRMVGESTTAQSIQNQFRAVLPGHELTQFLWAHEQANAKGSDKQQLLLQSVKFLQSTPELNQEQRVKVIQQYVAQCTINRGYFSQGKKTNDTTSIKNLLKDLNSAECPAAVKQEFRLALGKRDEAAFSPQDISHFIDRVEKVASGAMPPPITAPQALSNPALSTPFLSAFTGGGVEETKSFTPPGS